MLKKCSWLIILVALVWSQITLAGDAATGQAKSATCSVCHGATGVSSNDLWPNLAGQKEAYLIKQLKDFRNDIRNDPLMSPMAKPLTDTDIENLAAFYASQSE